MGRLFEIELTDLENLDAYNFNKLLSKLVRLEIEQLGVPSLCVAGTLKIDIPDGGEDLGVAWAGGPEPAKYIPDRKTLFQVKAKRKFGPSDCEKELFDSGYKLRPRVEEIFRTKGTYVLILQKPLTATQQSAYASKMRESLRKRRKAYGNAKIFVFGLDDLKNWADQHRAAVEWVKKINDKYPNIRLQLWEDLNNRTEHKGHFAPSSSQQSMLDELRKRPWMHSPISISGIAGIGKTRLVLELFRPTATEDSKRLRESLIYYNTQGADLQSTFDDLAYLLDCGSEGVLVVDECTDSFAAKLSREFAAKPSGMKLITISRTPPTMGRTMALLPATRAEISEAITKDFDLTDHMVNRISDFSGGNFEISRQLAQEAVENPHASYALQNNDFCAKLLNDPEYDPTIGSQRILSVIACFSQLEYVPMQQSECTYLFENIIGRSASEVDDTITKFLTRGVLVHEGDFISVSLTPLALSLARDGLRNNPRLAKSLLSTGTHLRLQDAFTKRLAEANLTMEGKRLVEEQVAVGGPFDSEEVLLSEHGSRLFLAFVEVSPNACLYLLKRVLPNVEPLSMREAAGRSNLVNAVQKLCWHADLFVEAALVYPLLLGKKEDFWSASFRREYLTLFHVFLPGTEADLKSRRTVIEQLLASENIDLGIDSLEASLNAHHFSRSGGPEEQGGRFPQKDYQPSTPELFEYWQQSLVQLADIALSDSVEAEKARDTLGKSIQGPALKGLFQAVIAIVSRVGEKNTTPWMSAIESLHRMLEIVPTNSTLKKTILSLQASLIPDTIPAKIEAMVTAPSWWGFSLESGMTTPDAAVAKAKGFALEMAVALPSLYEHLSQLQTGEQRQAFVFGEELITACQNPKPVVEQSLENLRSIPRAQANPGFLSGVLKSSQQIDPDFREGVLDALDADSELAWLVLPIIQGGKISEKDLSRLLLAVDRGSVDPRSIHQLSYGSVLAHLEPQPIIKFALGLSKSSAEGRLAALSILSMYRLSNDVSGKIIDASIQELLLSGKLLSIPEFHENRSGFHWSQATQRLLSAGTDPKLAASVSKDLINYAETNSLHAIDHLVEPILHILFTSYKEVWEMFGESVAKNDRSSWAILSMFQTDDFQGQTKPLLLDSLGHELFLKWCADHPQVLPRVARQIPILRVDNNVWSVEKVAREFLNRFGESEEVRQSFGTSMWSFGWTGSPLPQLIAMRKFLEEFCGDERIAVRKWALAGIKDFNASIAKEEKRLQNANMGVHTPF